MVAKVVVEVRMAMVARVVVVVEALRRAVSTVLEAPAMLAMMAKAVVEGLTIIMAMEATTVLEALSRAVVAMAMVRVVQVVLKAKLVAGTRKAPMVLAEQETMLLDVFLTVLVLDMPARVMMVTVLKMAEETVAILKIFTKSLAEVVALMLVAGALALMSFSDCKEASIDTSSDCLRSASDRTKAEAAKHDQSEYDCYPWENSGKRSLSPSPSDEQADLALLEAIGANLDKLAERTGCPSAPDQACLGRRF